MMLSSSLSARNARGKPPRSHRRSSFSEPTSAEPSQFVDLDPAGEGFAALPQQVGTGAPQHQEPGWNALAVGEDAQHREQLRPPLDLVEDHQPPQPTERGHGFVEPGQAQRVLEVEIVRRIGRNELSRERRLAALSRSDERDHRATPQRLPDEVGRRTQNHPA